MAEVKWIKIVTDIFDDEKILMIENLPDRDSIIVIWFKLLCMAGKQNNSGVFLFNDRIPYTDEMLSTIFRRPLNTVRLALKTFEEYGMIEIINNTITIPKWEKHQSLDALENSRKQTRNRVAKYREKQKEIACNGSCNVTCNVTDDVTVTLCNADRIRIDKDKEIEEDINIKADKSAEREKRVNLDDEIENYTTNPELMTTLHDYFRMRKAMKTPNTERAIKLCFNKLDILASTDEEKLKVVEQSIERGWKTFYPLKGDNKQEVYKQPTAADYDFSDWYK